jgi:uncharacterized protein YoxC
VSDSAVVFLAIMAVALVVMAVAQIALLVVGLKLARQINTTTEGLRQDLRPLLEKAHHLTDEATRVTTLARLQVERLERTMAAAAQQLDTTVAIIQGFMSGPVRQGSAAIAAFKAVLGVIRSVQNRKAPTRDTEEDALFVG